jgi:hypothetical protein
MPSNFLESGLHEPPCRVVPVGRGDGADQKQYADPWKEKREVTFLVGTPPNLDSYMSRPRVTSRSASSTSTEWDETTGRLVQPLLRRSLEMCREIARDGWWN